MLTVAEARDRILRRMAALDAEDLPLIASHGHVLADDVRSESEVPPFANSAMDGYAVLASDVRNASSVSPVRLTVVGEVRAGSPPPAAVGPGTALRIMTGAMLPDGADAVVRVEDTSEANGEVEVRAAVDPGTSLRAAGSDIHRGDLVAAAGRVATPGLVGVIASAGRTSVRCIRRPRVLVLTTGDELRAAGETLQPGQIINTNRYTLAAAVEEAGGQVIDVGVARDERADLLDRLQATRDADLLITSGGVSMGAYDLVRQVMESTDTVDFWQVALRPGSPCCLGSSAAFR